MKRNNINFILIYLFLLACYAKSQDADYVTKLIKINKEYRLYVSHEILKEGTYIIFTSYDTSPLRRANGKAGIDFEMININDRYEDYRILQRVKLSSEDSKSILTSLSKSIIGKPIDVGLGNTTTHKITIFRKDGSTILNSLIHCYGMIEIRYPITNYLNRLNSNLYLEAIKHAPLNDKQLEFLSQKVFDDKILAIIKKNNGKNRIDGNTNK